MGNDRYDWATIFQCDLPAAGVYFLSNAFVQQMCLASNSSVTAAECYRIKSTVAREHITAALNAAGGNA